jgi:hypothetical protein
MSVKQRAGLLGEQPGERLPWAEVIETTWRVAVEEIEAELTAHS